MKNTPKASRVHTTKVLDRFTVRLILGTRGISTAIARISGYSKGHVADIISGRRAVTQRFIDAMTEAFGRDSELRQRAVMNVRYGTELKDKSA